MRPKADVGNKVAVHHVQVQKIRPAAQHVFDLTIELGKICRQYRRGDLRGGRGEGFLGHGCPRQSRISSVLKCPFSRNSSDAPPPVLTWLTLSARCICSTAAALSPPPMIVTALFFAVASATAWAMARVPSANGFFSNTPIGPFHTIVLALAILSLNSATVLGPMSKPSRPSGTPPSATCVFALSVI